MYGAITTCFSSLLHSIFLLLGGHNTQLTRLANERTDIIHFGTNILGKNRFLTQYIYTKRNYTIQSEMIPTYLLSSYHWQVHTIYVCWDRSYNKMSKLIPALPVRFQLIILNVFIGFFPLFSLWKTGSLLQIHDFPLTSCRRFEWEL